MRMVLFHGEMQVFLLVVLAIALAGTGATAWLMGMAAFWIAITGLFIFGTMPFWFLVGFLSIFVTLFVDEEDLKYEGRGFCALPFVLMLLVVLQFFGDIKVFSYWWEHKIMGTVWLLGYLVVGLIYAFGRFLWLTHDRKEKLEEAMAEFTSKHGIKDKLIPENIFHEWEREVLKYKKPEWKQSKARIARWAAYWPWSFVWFFFSDFLKNIYHKMLEALRHYFETARDKIWGDMDVQVAAFTKVVNPAEASESLRGDQRRAEEGRGIGRDKRSWGSIGRYV